MPLNSFRVPSVFFRQLWRTWKYTLGSFNDVKTKPYDNHITIIRSVILLGYMMTNMFIVAGVVRHWDSGKTVQPTYQRNSQ